MSQPASAEAPKTRMQRILDVVERVGNKVPHPVVIFLTLIAVVVVLSQLFFLLGASVTTEVIAPEQAAPATCLEGYEYSKELSKPQKPKVVETKVRGLLTRDGLRFMYVSIIPSFMSFTGLGLIIVAMIGVGVAEQAGLVNALIRKLVIVSPRWAITYILVFVGILSSIAADAGYLVLIPLAGVAFASIGRHPLAGIATGFAAVAAAFTVNMLIKPLDAILVEFTNDAIRIAPGDHPTIGLTSNLWFSFVSVPFLTVLVTLITERIIEPRLGAYKPEKPTPEGEGLAKASGEQPAVQDAITTAPQASAPSGPEAGEQAAGEAAGLSADESRGLRFAGLALIGVLVLFGLLALPSGAPLRDPDTDKLIGNTPFMNGLIGFVMVVFLATGAAYGIGAGKMKNMGDVIKAIEKSMSGLGSLIFLFFILSQFVAYFNYSNLGTVMAIKMADALKSANIGPGWLLFGFIVVVLILDFIITGAIAKWAIFAPIFVPVLVTLGVAPEAVLAAYRVADSPVNAITPLNAYFAFVVTTAQKYDKTAGVGTIVSLMLPYVVLMTVLWTLLFFVWYWLGLPWGL
jgi:aminobenzoyl-glutamate transport protein